MPPQPPGDGLSEPLRAGHVKVVTYLVHSHELSGRDRLSKPVHQDRDRASRHHGRAWMWWIVRKAVATAIERIAAVDASLGRLVHDTVSTCSTCRYDPDPDRPSRWILKA